jgi:hypothetical protein
VQVDKKCLLDYFNLAVKLPDNYDLNEATLTRAVHSSYGNITEALKNDDQVYSILEPEQSIELRFAKVPLSIGKLRSYILVSNGRYKRVAEKSSIESQLLPESFSLRGCYPNPFNPQTVVEYTVSTPSHVNITVYNLLGQSVVRLVDIEQNAGYYSTRWNAIGVASGVYYLRMTVTDSFGKQLYQTSQKLLLMK